MPIFNHTNLVAATLRGAGGSRLRSTMSRNIVASIACCALLFVCTSLSRTSDLRIIRRPLGVYAKVDIENAISAYTGSASPSPAELHSYLRMLYADLLSNQAISGITVGQRWDHIQLSDTVSSEGAPDGYDWSYLDDAFAEARTAQKSVQLIITPGFDSPQWLLAKIPSCDGLFNNGMVQADCGKVTFEGFPETQRADGKVLPLPWNPVYQHAWDDFLTHLNARYNQNPAFVSIAVAGAIGASDEIILPTSANTPTQPSGLNVNEMWVTLIGNSFPDSSGSYRRSDQVFIDSWKQAIDAYENIFAGVTLFIGADSGSDLPNFGHNVTPHTDNTLYASDCAASIASTDSTSGLYRDLMPCEAKAEILSYFLAAAGPNGKSTQVGGMKASSPDTLAIGDIGIAGVKLLTSLSPPPSPSFFGGAEFDHPVSGNNNLQEEGCTDPNGGCTDLTVEKAAYNVLTVFFNGTPAATFYNGTLGTAHMHYLEIPYVDVQYAETHRSPITPSPIIGMMSMQDLLDRASRDLFEMEGPPFTISVNPSSQTVSPGSSTSFTINAQSAIGSPWPISLSATVTPSASTVITSFSRNTVTAGGDSVLTVSTTAGTLPSVFSINITATSTGIVQTAAATVTVIPGPSIGAVAFDGAKKIKISGSRFGSAPRVLINNSDRSDFINFLSDTMILLKGKEKKLGLNAGDNSIQVIDAAGTASTVFVLRL